MGEFETITSVASIIQEETSPEATTSELKPLPADTIAEYAAIMQDSANAAARRQYYSDLANQSLLESGT